MAVSPKNLIIPGKNSRGAHLGYKDDMRTIEIWANQLKSGGIQEITSTGGTVAVTNPFGPVTNLESLATGGGYASLTGPGETTTPGALTQAGPFTVNAGASGAVTLTSTLSGNAIVLNATGSSGNMVVNVNTDITFNTLSFHVIGSGSVSLFTTGTVQLSGNTGILVGITTDKVHIAGSSGLIGFFGAIPIVKQTITGAKGGNVALGNLLSALVSMGLITDSTTP